MSSPLWTHQFPSKLTLSLEVPLWRNLAVDSSRLRIRVASKNVERSQADLRTQVVAQLQRALGTALESFQISIEP